MRNSTKIFRQTRSPLALVVLASATVLSAGASAQTLHGNPYRPTGANYQIFASQGIDASTPLGKSGFGTQVNTDFEFTPSIGVTYEQANKLVNFGIGLYKDSANQTQSTGLTVKYDAAINAYSGSVTVMDFDLKSDATGFKPNKVEPSMLIFGSNNSVIASFNPDDIFASMVEQVDSHGKGKDIWDINFGTLLSKAHINDTTISGFQLYADSMRGEAPASDPYLMVSVGKGQMVPEPATLSCIGLGILFLRRRNKARN